MADNIMDCAEARDLLSAWIDGEAASDGPALESHLGGCPECSRELAELRHTVEAVQALPRITVPSDFSHKVMAALAKSEDSLADPESPAPVAMAQLPAGSPVRSLRGLRWVASAAVVMLGVGLAMFAGTNRFAGTMQVDMARHSPPAAESASLSEQFKASERPSEGDHAGVGQKSEDSELAAKDSALGLAAPKTLLLDERRSDSDEAPTNNGPLRASSRLKAAGKDIEESDLSLLKESVGRLAPPPEPPPAGFAEPRPSPPAVNELDGLTVGGFGIPERDYEEKEDSATDELSDEKANAPPPPGAGREPLDLQRARESGRLDRAQSLEDLDSDGAKNEEERRTRQMGAQRRGVARARTGRANEIEPEKGADSQAWLRQTIPPIDAPEATVPETNRSKDAPEAAASVSKKPAPEPSADKLPEMQYRGRAAENPPRGSAPQMKFRGQDGSVDVVPVDGTPSAGLLDFAFKGAVVLTVEAGEAATFTLALETALEEGDRALARVALAGAEAEDKPGLRNILAKGKIGGGGGAAWDKAGAPSWYSLANGDQLREVVVSEETYQRVLGLVANSGHFFRVDRPGAAESPAAGNAAPEAKRRVGRLAKADLAEADSPEAEHGSRTRPNAAASAPVPEETTAAGAGGMLPGGEADDDAPEAAPKLADTPATGEPEPGQAAPLVSPEGLARKLSRGLDPGMDLIREENAPPAPLQQQRRLRLIIVVKPQH